MSGPFDHIKDPIERARRRKSAQNRLDDEIELDKIREELERNGIPSDIGDERPQSSNPFDD